MYDGVRLITQLSATLHLIFLQTRLAKNQDIIVVAMNYRTNIFGFPTGEELFPAKVRILGPTSIPTVGAGEYHRLWRRPKEIYHNGTT